MLLRHRSRSQPEPLPDYRYSAQDRRDPLEPLLKEVLPDVLRPKPRCLNDRLGLSNVLILLP